MIYIAVSIDLFSDGLLIGAGSAVSPSVAIILAAGQVLADVPEGFATIATMKDKGIPRSKRILLSASFAIPVLSAAVFAYFVLRNQPEAFKLAALTFTAGFSRSLPSKIWSPRLTRAVTIRTSHRWLS